MEFFLSLRFKKFVREHKEDPWDWLRLGTKEIKNTRLRYHGGLHSGFEFIPECIRRLVIQTIVKYGVTLTRTSNAWNNYELLGKEANELKKLGMETVMNLIYSISPRHTDEYYAQKARDAAALKPYRLCFKDVGGMLTPGTNAHVGPAHQAKCAERAAGVSRPLQQRLGAVQFTRGGQGRDSHRAYGDSAAGQRLFTAVGFQRRQQSARARLQTAGQCRCAPAGERTF